MCIDLRRDVSAEKAKRKFERKYFHYEQSSEVDQQLLDEVEHDTENYQGTCIATPVVTKLLVHTALWDLVKVVYIAQWSNEIV